LASEGITSGIISWDIPQFVFQVLFSGWVIEEPPSRFILTRGATVANLGKGLVTNYNDVI
jgi:hypothetical protein